MNAQPVSALIQPCVVQVGGRPLVAAPCQAQLERRHVRIHKDAEALFVKAERSTVPVQHFALHCRSFKDVGFNTKASLQALYEKVAAEELQFCTPELIIRLLELPQSALRLGKFCVVAMEPFPDEVGRPFIALLSGVQKPDCPVSPMLRMIGSNPLTQWPPNTEVLFCKPL